MNSIASALAGIQSANHRFENAAQKIAQWETTNQDTDLAAQSVEMMTAQIQLKLNATALRSEEEVSQSVLNILA